MKGKRHRLLLAVAIAVAALTSCAPALGAPRQVEKLELGPELGQPEKLVAYDRSRLLLLRRFSSEPSIMRVNFDGSLDRSFGVRGRLEMPFSDVVAMPDGKILVAAAARSPSDPSDSDVQVTRLLRGGAPDRSFGDGGTAYVDLGGRYDGADTVMLAVKGRIVIGGRKQTVPWTRGDGSDAVPALARLLPNGRLDRSFSRDGIRLLPGGSEGAVIDVARAPGGGIVAQCEALTGTSLWKIKSSGAPDRRFGKRGRVALTGRSRRLQHGRRETLNLVPKIGVLANGKILLAGMASRYEPGHSHHRMLAVRLRADGGIDRSYGKRGYAHAGVGGWSFAQSAAFLRDGRLIVAASTQLPIGRDSDLEMVAFAKGGRLDRRFGNRGRLRVELGGWDSASDVVTQNKRAVALGSPGDGRPAWLVRASLLSPRNR